MDGFKFEIGEIVTTVAGISQVESYKKHREALPESQRWQRDLGAVAYPRIQITERLMQECPGGIQRHYKARTFTRDGHQVIDYLDIEIAALPDDPDVF